MRGTRGAQERPTHSERKNYLSNVHRHSFGSSRLRQSAWASVTPRCSPRVLLPLGFASLRTCDSRQRTAGEQAKTVIPDPFFRHIVTWVQDVMGHETLSAGLGLGQLEDSTLEAQRACHCLRRNKPLPLFILTAARRKEANLNCPLGGIQSPQGCPKGAPERTKEPQ